jgi:hypothetical protein
MTVIKESRFRARLSGRQVSPDAVRAFDAFVERAMDEVAGEAERDGVKRIDGTLVRRALRGRG